MWHLFIPVQLYSQRARKLRLPDAKSNSNIATLFSGSIQQLTLPPVASLPAAHPDQQVEQISDILKTLSELRTLTETTNVPTREAMVVGIEPLRALIRALPQGQPQRPMLLRNLGYALEDRFSQQGATSDLEEAVTCYSEALGLLPVGHDDRGVSLFHLSNSLRSRFIRSGHMADLDNAAARIHEALAVCPPAHEDRIPFLRSMANTLRTRFEKLHNMEDLDQAIMCLQEIHLAVSIEDPDRCLSFYNLAKALETRFELQGSVADLDKAITYSHEAVKLSPQGHPFLSMAHMNLAYQLQTHAKQQGNLANLDAAITHYTRALDLLPHGHPAHSTSLYNLANNLFYRFEQKGNPTDVNAAISYHQQALKFHIPGHPYQPMSLNNLGNTLLGRFRMLGNVDDLQDGIDHLKKALELRPPGHPDRSITLVNLAAALHTRFEHLGDPCDLDVAVAYCEGALDSTGLGQPSSFHLLQTLARVLFQRFQQNGNMEDIDKAISYLHQSLQQPIDQPHHSTTLDDLGSALHARFEANGKIEELDEAVACHTKAIELCPRGHPSCHLTLSNSASALQKRFENRGNMADLHRAVTLSRKAVVLCPPQSQNHFACLTNMASTLKTLFGVEGNPSHLDEAITCFKLALESHPPTHSRHSTTLNNLGSALCTRFEQMGNTTDLDAAVMYHRHALQLCAQGHHDRPGCFINLAGALETRFGVQSKASDLDEAVFYGCEAVALLPTEHTRYPAALGALGRLLGKRFQWLGDATDLATAIIHLQEAVELGQSRHCPDDTSMNNLAAELMKRFSLQKNQEDLDGAITLFRSALELRPLGHEERPSSLINLAQVLLTRFEEHHSALDLKTAISLLHEGHTLPPNHPYQAEFSIVLARAYGLGNDGEDLANMFPLVEKAITHPSAGLMRRFRVAASWASLAHHHDHVSATTAYSLSLNLLHKVVAMYPTINLQLGVLKHHQEKLVQNAVAYAIKTGELSMAVEVLEHGRAILWASMSGYRSPLEELSNAGHEKIAKEFYSLSQQLERRPRSSGNNETTMARDEEARKYGLLLEEYNQVLTQIHQLPGFSTFLQAVPFQTLQLAAFRGPVILVNISSYSSDALIVRDHGDPILVPLPDATPDAIERILGDFKDFQDLTKSEDLWDVKKRSNLLPKILRALWIKVVQPIVDRLHSLPLPHHSRIWWCPTSTLCLLPLHAAGPWRTGLKNLPDMFTSSYTPTLSALLRANAPKSAHSTPMTPNFLAIGVPQPLGDKRKLPNVEAELLQIKEVTSAAGHHVNLMEGENATRDVVLRDLSQYSWVHFSCHGKQDLEAPFLSRFSLYDGPLSLHDITKAHLPNAELAFLAACHAATGDKNTPDEVIHLAAGLQFSGFRSVVGTLWPMADEDAPALAKAFYGYMFRSGADKADYRDAAQGLKVAIDVLRTTKGMTSERWVNFIHIGA